MILVFEIAVGVEILRLDFVVVLFSGFRILNILKSLGVFGIIGFFWFEVSNL